MSPVGIGLLKEPVGLTGCGLGCAGETVGGGETATTGFGGASGGDMKVVRSAAIRLRKASMWVSVFRGL